MPNIPTMDPTLQTHGLPTTPGKTGPELQPTPCRTCSSPRIPRRTSLPCAPTPGRGSRRTHGEIYLQQSVMHRQWEFRLRMMAVAPGGAARSGVYYSSIDSITSYTPTAHQTNVRLRKRSSEHSKPCPARCPLPPSPPRPQTIPKKPPRKVKTHQENAVLRFPTHFGRLTHVEHWQELREDDGLHRPTVLPASSPTREKEKQHAQRMRLYSKSTGQGWRTERHTSSYGAAVKTPF